MPIQIQRTTNEIVSTVWTSPLRSEDVSACFGELERQIEEADSTIHVLFDITNAGNIPAQAPFLFFRSGMTKHPNLGRMAVIGTNPLAQILGQMAVNMTGQNILFFATEADAINYLVGG